jgi:hypothetical protein
VRWRVRQNRGGGRVKGWDGVVESEIQCGICMMISCSKKEKKGRCESDERNNKLIQEKISRRTKKETERCGRGHSVWEGLRSNNTGGDDGDGVVKETAIVMMMGDDDYAHLAGFSHPSALQHEDVRIKVQRF